MKVTEESFQFSRKEMMSMPGWMNFNGFSGESCGKCNKTANILGGGPGWICVCESYNAQDFYHNRAPHENPDLGPTKSEIQEALNESRRL